MNAKLSIPHLFFELPKAPLESEIRKVDALTEKLKTLKEKAGTESDRFIKARKRIEMALKQGVSLVPVLSTSVDLRVLAILFNTEFSSNIVLSEPVFRKIISVRKKPGALLVEAIYGHYLSKYDQLQEVKIVERWLREAKKLRSEMTGETERILSGIGPKWLAEESYRNGRDFDEQLKVVMLDRYPVGRFITVAKNIYYLEVLRGLQPNEAHSILDEMQKKSAYDAQYDENSLLGHQILNILIKKSPISGVSEVWLNVILAIAGDPRVPKAHPNYRKWWSQLDAQLGNKVKGWLSKLDLKLFLEALESFSNLPGKEELKRMYPARKQFMQGLLKKQLVIGTRLFLSRGAEQYLKNNYEPEHLPNYSLVKGNISVIHIQLAGGGHIVEGSHSCKLWVYERLDPSATLFDYSKTHFSYSSLTGGLRDQMLKLGLQHEVDITHRFNWQHEAILALKNVGVPINSKDVLTLDDYKKYKRMYGA
ncbi:MAG: EH signature domain-containing protein [Gammaproteobacteria bacterium]|nr:EH signature domain-containing protein [Gammaproteobacteria bacterium]